MKRKSCIIDLQICVYYAYIYIYSFTYIEITQLSNIFHFSNIFKRKKRKKRSQTTVDKKKKQPSKSLINKNFEKQESFLIHTRIIYIVSNAKEIRSSQKSYCRKNSIFHSIFCAIIIRKNLYIEKKNRIKRRERKKKEKKNER